MNAPSPRYSLARQFLRDATHLDHVRLNQHPLLVGITKPDYPLAAYYRVLKVYFRIYENIECAITRHLSESPSYVDGNRQRFDYAPRMKGPWLRQDLRYAKIDPASIAAQPNPLAITSTPQLVGVLYAIEGSSLGGKVISQHISQNLGLTPTAGGRFFYGYGDQILPLWREFESFMEFALSSPDQMEVAASAAKQIFSYLEQMLDGA